MNYGRRFVTLYRRQGSRPSPWKRNAKKQNGSLRRLYTLELTPQKDVLFIIGDWNAKVGSQETPGVTGKFGLGMQNEAG